MKYQVRIEKKFSSAHALREYKGKCEKLHGHNWKVEVSVSGNKLDKLGMLIDFNDLRSILNKIFEKIDHNYLNEIEPFDKINPTAENIAMYIFNQLRASLKSIYKEKLEVTKIRVWESDTSSAEILGSVLEI